MASTYYDSAGKEVVDGDVAYASDLNDINTAVNTAFEQVETDIGTLGSNQSYYADLAEQWATEAEDVEVEPGKYSAYNWAQKADDDATATAADRVQTGLDRTAASNSASSASASALAASNSATAASNSATTALGHANTAAGHASDASDSADAAAASAALFPTFGAGDQGKYLKVGTPYTNGIITSTLDLSSYAPLNSPALIGIPTAPTAAAGTDTTQLATTEFVTSAIENKSLESIPNVQPASPISGLDITTSGQVITVTPGACLDSTEEVAMAITTNKTWTVPSTNNLETYLFLVRLVADGSFDVKGYSTLAGPSSDATVDAWRFISWARNNGSGVLMPYLQVGNRIDWLVGTNRPVLTASLTTSFVSYSISAIVPIALLHSVSILESNNQAMIASYDGSTPIVAAYPASSTMGAELQLHPVSSIYLKASSATTPVAFYSITLRR